MNWEFKDGDLIRSDEPVIAHGCNCYGAMGSGIARQVKEEMYEVYAQYAKTCHVGKFRIGTAQAIWTGPSGSQRLVFNLGTQNQPGADATAWGIFLSFANMAEHCRRLGVRRVAIPRIGAGIGGLSWSNDVVPAIEEAMDRTTNPLDIVVYDIVPWKEN